MDTSPTEAYARHRRTTKDKVHRRAVRLGSRDFSVLSLRPSTQYRFATNWFHNTWHVLCNAGSAHYLGRLLWGLSYQRTPNTVLVIDDPFLQPNPFDANPSRRFAFINTSTSSIGRQESRQLAKLLPLGSTGRHRHPSGTVVMHSHGRARALQHSAHGDHADFEADERGWGVDTAGLIIFAISADNMRQLSLGLDLFDDLTGVAGSAVFFARSDPNYWYPDGEFQLVPQFSAKVRAARQRRRTRFPGRDHEQLELDEQMSVW